MEQQGTNGGDKVILTRNDQQMPDWSADRKVQQAGISTEAQTSSASEAPSQGEVGRAPVELDGVKSVNPGLVSPAWSRVVKEGHGLKHVPGKGSVQTRPRQNPKEKKRYCGNQCWRKAQGSNN